MTVHRGTAITDKQGKRFYIGWDDETERIFIYRPLLGADLMVGWTNYRIEPPLTMKLDNIELLEAPIVFRRGVCKCLRLPQWLWGKWQRESYERRGLGSALLEAVIELARSKGLQKIKGFIVAGDYWKNPNLPSWYESYGFTVEPTPPDVREKTGQVWWIELTIEPMEEEASE